MEAILQRMQFLSESTRRVATVQRTDTCSDWQRPVIRGGRLSPPLPTVVLSDRTSASHLVEARENEGPIEPHPRASAECGPGAHWDTVTACVGLGQPELLGFRNRSDGPAAREQAERIATNPIVF